MFDAAYGYDAVANPKPAPDTVHAFCDLTGLKPSEIAMVGDNRHDLEMAQGRRRGLAVGVLSGTGTRESLHRWRTWCWIRSSTCRPISRPETERTVARRSRLVQWCTGLPR